MHCLDCFLAHRNADALAVCHDCGAGVCADHAVIRDRHLTRTAPINRTITVEPAARIIRCPACDAAHTGAHPTPRSRKNAQAEMPQPNLT